MTIEPGPIGDHFRPLGGTFGTVATLLQRVFEQCALPLVASVSATTRAARVRASVPGVDYYFLGRDEFARRRDSGEFLESCEVYAQGDWYGTLRSEVTPSLAAGKWVVLEIDVQGTREVLRHYPRALTIFVQPGSLDGVERRLRDRGTESGSGAWSGGWPRGPPRAGFGRHLSATRSSTIRIDRATRDLRYSQSGKFATSRRSFRMIDELREERIVNKVGGRFKLSTLIQKRLVALNAGSRPLVSLDTHDKLEIVIQEIMQDKIYLDSSTNLRITGEPEAGGGPPELDLSDL